MGKIRRPLQKAERRCRKQKGIAESRKPLRKIGKPLRKIGKRSRKIELRARKIGFQARKIPIFPRDSLASGNFGVLFCYQIFYHVHAWIYFVEVKYSQLKIHHLSDTPSTKGSGGRIYSDVFIKDVKATRRSSWLPFLPTLPDGHVLMAAFVGMDKDRFSLMFINDLQVICASGSDCKVHPGTGPVDESFHWCMICALKSHSCITCSGVRFADWISCAAARGEFYVSMLSQYRQEKFDHYKDNFSSLPLELCSYCQKSIALSIDGDPGPAGDAAGTSVEGTSVDSAGFLLSSKEHY